MPVFPQTLLAFVRSHLVSLSLFTAWHDYSLLFNIRLDFVDESLGRLK